MTSITLGKMEGIITFPSFHTACAVLLPYLFRQHRYLRWPVLAMNVLMLFSIPNHGYHYLVDMLAGAPIAGLAIGLQRRLIR
jgi:hypothetical protein